MGETVESTLGITTAGDLWSYPLQDLSRRFGNETGTWLFNICRGICTDPVQDVSSLKSMLSAKSLRPPALNLQDVDRWLITLCGELLTRITEELSDNKRWPKTLVLNYKSTWMAAERSRSVPMPPLISVQNAADFAKMVKSMLTHEMHKLESERKNIFPLDRVSVSCTNFHVDDGGSASGKSMQMWLHSSKNSNEGTQPKRRADDDFVAPLPVNKRFESPHTPTQHSGAVDQNTPIPPNSCFQSTPLSRNSISGSFTPNVQNFDRTPSQLLHDQMGFTPFDENHRNAWHIETVDLTAETPTADKEPSNCNNTRTPVAADSHSGDEIDLNGESDEMETIIFPCKECGQPLLQSEPLAIQEHMDWHLALKLADTGPAIRSSTWGKSKPAERPGSSSSSTSRKADTGKREPKQSISTRFPSVPVSFFFKKAHDPRKTENDDLQM